MLNSCMFCFKKKAHDRASKNINMKSTTNGIIGLAPNRNNMYDMGTINIRIEPLAILIFRTLPVACMPNIKGENKVLTRFMHSDITQN